MPYVLVDIIKQLKSTIKPACDQIGTLLGEHY